MSLYYTFLVVFFACTAEAFTNKGKYGSAAFTFSLLVAVGLCAIVSAIVRAIKESKVSA